ncbi:MAG TPA: prolipoprotein diacylglyceryl transferase family protein [Kofleriaceae bacterium]|nr:prolipoprotein diacylglyceryl transferase family protein [Kofleriaceae bacterium]
MPTLALLMSAGTASATTGLPYFHLGAMDIGIPIQWFGLIVAVGVLLGAMPLRRYAEWHGVSDEHIRGLLTWIMISGFLGAHEFDVLAYQFHKLGDSTIVEPAHWWFLPVGLWPSNWPLPLRIWDGISSYGGFVGGSIGFALFVWWKRLPVRLFADITIAGLLPAFTIGRIGCTVVSDHIGAAVDPRSWYAFLAMDYPRKLNLAGLAEAYPGTSEMIRAWNLGLIEFLYLVPVNVLILWLAFRSSKRQPAGFITALTGVLYAPVRFFLDFLRPEDTDPRGLGLTFAQWASIVAFGAAIYAASRILKTGTAAETVARTSGEAQERLRIILREDGESKEQEEADRKAEAERKKAEIARARAEREREDAAAKAAGDAATGAVDQSGDEDEDESDEEAERGESEAARPAAPAKPATGGARPGAGKPGAGQSATGKPASKPGAGKSSSKSGKSGKTKGRKR